MKPLECRNWSGRIQNLRPPAALAIIFFTAQWLLAPMSVWAGGVVTVCTEASLRAAMTGGGTVTFACDGVITLANTLTNDSDTAIDGSGHQIIISGGNGVRVLAACDRSRLTLMNLTIANGASTINGAGLLNSSGFVFATNCVFSRNAVSLVANGGAIYNNGTMVLDLCQCTNNQAVGANGTLGPMAIGGDAAGGAVWNNGVLRMLRTTFSDNHATGGTAGWGNSPGAPGGNGNGGAVYNVGELWMEACTLFNNSAQGGAGGIGATGIAIFDIATDGATGGTGGFGIGGLYNASVAVIINSTFESDFATGGTGGAGGTGGTGQLMGGNGGTGGDGGIGFGAIYDSTGSLFLTNCSIAFNSGMGGMAGAGGAGGGHSYPSGQSGSAGGEGSYGWGSAGGIKSYGGCLANTLLAGNSMNCSGIITDAGHNLSSDASYNFSGSGSITDTDPKLGPLADNGGPTLTMALLPDSPAIDAGTAVGAPAADQRGVPRPQGAGVDIGAFEYLYNPVFTGVTIPNATNRQMQMSGFTPTQAITLQVSTNLFDWFDLANFTADANGTFQCADPIRGDCQSRFYRLKSVAP